MMTTKNFSSTPAAKKKLRLKLVKGKRLWDSRKMKRNWAKVNHKIKKLFENCNPLVGLLEIILFFL